MSLDVTIKKATLDQKSILERLLQLYLYDFSEFDTEELNGQGVFEYRYLDHYWKETGRIPFIIYFNSKIAGFILINTHNKLSKNLGAKVVAEFFVLRKYRQKGVGKQAAFLVFDQFPGLWEVFVLDINSTGQKFWKKAINEYQKGDFQLEEYSDEHDQGKVYSFKN